MEIDHDQRNLHGEVIGTELTEVMSESVLAGLGEFSDDTPPGMTPVTLYKEEEGNKKITIPIDEIEGISKSDEPGKFNLLRSSIVDNKKVIVPIIITGAALMALYASRKYKNKKN